MYSTVDVRQQRISPDSKILFVSRKSSADVAGEAFRLGALGYVAKTQAGIELLTAVEAVCQGRRVSSFTESDQWRYLARELVVRPVLAFAVF